MVAFVSVPHSYSGMVIQVWKTECAVIYGPVCVLFSPELDALCQLCSNIYDLTFQAGFVV